MASFYPLKVKEIQRITPSAVMISFEIPENLKHVFSFTAGQYITIKKIVNGKEIRRSYSICSSHMDDLLRVGIKKVPKGTFSAYANDELQIGDVLEVHPPEGKFIFMPDPSKKRNLIAFAAGSGITPIMSIIKTVLEEEPNSSFVLVYGNKSVAETMFHEELLALIEKFTIRLSVYFIYSRNTEDGALFGRIDRSMVNFILKNKYKEVAFDTFYLCGPEEMIETVSEILKENTVSDKQIKFELFTTSNEEEPSKDVPEGKTKITIWVDDEETSFVMDKSQRILDAALAQKIDAPYSCQGGICSSCIARIKEGSATMVKNQILTDSEVAEGLILTCQANPDSETLVIDYDDV
ncbi:ferredoxin--NADP reductase [Leptobacterium sp. I13]|uniref:ferredoxin--NADP reductase n=1 Tax=Leptobacterium meishanense TaxID=3128904 RepID=UPI0030EBAD46